MPFTKLPLVALLLLAASACSAGSQQYTQSHTDLRLRNLTQGHVAAPLRDSYPVKGDFIPTPSDTQTRYFLIHQRAPLFGNTVVALLREEGQGKAAYARVEMDCGRRMFHIIGIGNRRSFAETSTNSEGPLRPIRNEPLREEIASFVCAQHGTPLANRT